MKESKSSESDPSPIPMKAVALLFGVALLAIGLAYLWKKGDLSWNKDIQAQDVEDKLFGYQKKRQNLAGAVS